MTSPAIFSHFAVRVVEGDELNFSFWTQVPENIMCRKFIAPRQNY